MSRTPIETQAAAVGALTEGMSLRAVSRLTGLSRARLGKLVLQMGRASERLLEEKIRGFSCEQIEADELWLIVKKRRNRVRPEDPAEVGDTWVWSGVDPDSKLIPAHHVGKRQLPDAKAFARQLRQRVEGRVQFNTDRLQSYRAAILGEFSTWNGESWERPDWGTVVKHFEVDPAAEGGRYVPPRVVSVDRRVETGRPNVNRISTSHVEAHHLHFRMRNKRAARLGNGISKSLEHLRASVATYFAHYNFVRRHSTIREVPAVAAGLMEKPMTLAELSEWGEIYGR